MARNIRLNNAGNLIPPDEATGRKWWGKHGYTGIDEGGYAMFDTPAGGRAALEQQIRIDQGRPQTQTEFIGKYVSGRKTGTPIEGGADPQGERNAQRNIPLLTGASPDTLLSEIDKDVLFNAIVQNEGGKDSVKHFAKPKLDFDALDRSVGALDSTTEAARFAPAPTIESETIGGAKPTATGLTGDQLTQRILDQDAALAKEEASRPPLPAAAAPATGGSMMTPVGPVGAPAAQAMPDISTALTSQAGAGEPGLLDKWKSVLSGESEFSAGGLSEEERAAFAKLSPSERMTKEPRDDLKGKRLFNLQPSVTPTAGRDPDLPDEFGTEKTQAGGVPLVSEAEIAEQYGEILRPQNKFTPQDTAQPELPDDVDAMGMDLDGMAPPEKAGLLSRLGGFAQNNPELLAQIAQAGGGFMQDIAQGRAQKKADAKTRGAMAQSNLIGALTGGKSRPAVMREEAEQGGLLARLGQAVEAGGRVAGGEMQRRTALSQRDEEMGLKGRKVAAGERQGDLMSKRLGIMQDKINKEYEINNKAAQVALAEATGASYERVQGGIESLNKATNIYKGGGYLDPTQGAKNLYGQMRVLYNDYDKDATPANVGAIFQVYQRFFDPATVREGDLKILQEAEGTFRRIQARAERLVGAGGSLSSDTVEEMKRITDKVHSMQARKATEDVNAYISTALDPRDREATSEYYDRIFKMPSLSDSGDKGDLVKDLGQTEIKL